MSAAPVIFWFRDDLRLADNAGLAEAHGEGRPVLTVYIHDEASPGVRPPGGASRWWLDKSLKALSDDIAARGGRLVLRSGPAAKVLDALIAETGAETVFWNRRYGPARETDARIKAALKAKGVEVRSSNASCLIEPFDIATGSGGGFKVFTPFWRALRSRYQPPALRRAPREMHALSGVNSETLASWKLHPSKPDWSGGFTDDWTPGEQGAAKRLRDFIGSSANYAEERDRPDIDATSRLSPHLHFGEVGPAQVWRAVSAAQDAGRMRDRDAEKFLSELAWREFSIHLLYHDPEMGRLSWRRRFDELDWRRLKAKEIAAWRQGRTGYPIVDAGMRQLWRTGWMHNRVRMIAASFLTKHLLVHWRTGEEWFWDTLVDADEANNANGWQWTAGSGADASPYFRVFNPVLQGEKFDPDGAYVRAWVPELADLPSRFIHRPWDADPVTLAAAGVKLGETYPEPLVDHAFARQRALDAYAAIRSET